MTNFKGEKKNVEGASKVALTGDRFLTCFPSHLLWVKARRQSQIQRSEKRGVRLERMVRAAGNIANEILTSNGRKLFICIVNLSVLNCCGMGVYARQELSIQPIQRHNKLMLFIQLQKYLSGLSYWILQ